ncbi:MAG TPA: hypothetical protein VF941_22425 [Clostridia bacterium]
MVKVEKLIQVIITLVMITSFCIKSKPPAKLVEEKRLMPLSKKPLMLKLMQV